VKVLAACESSGVVREAFRAMGHDAYSCDILPADDASPYHFQCDVFEVIERGGWDLMVAFPPCTDLTVSGAKHFKKKLADGRQRAGADFFLALAHAPIERIAIENPVGVMPTRYFRPSDCIVHPWEHGEEHEKTTCLWLKNLPPIVPTRIVSKGARHVTRSGKSLPAWYNLPPSVNRAKLRSRTFRGIAEAMAAQWGAPSAASFQAVLPLAF